MSDTSSVILAPDDDPIKVLQAMAKFLPGEYRFTAEIKDAAQTLGFVVITGDVNEQTLRPIYDAATRRAEVSLLAGWLQSRGYEASACKWISNTTNRANLYGADVKWTLATGPAQVPKLPPEPPDISALQEFGRAVAGHGPRHRLRYARR